MTTKPIHTANRQVLSPRDVSSDISILRRLPSSSRQTLLNLTSPTPPTTPSSIQSAVDELRRFSPSSSTPEQSLRLSKAYVADMTSIRSWDDGRLEKLGDGVDALRREGEGVRDALGEVKL